LSWAGTRRGGGRWEWSRGTNRNHAKSTFAKTTREQEKFKKAPRTRRDKARGGRGKEKGFPGSLTIQIMERFLKLRVMWETRRIIKGKTIRGEGGPEKKEDRLRGVTGCNQGRSLVVGKTLDSCTKGEEKRRKRKEGGGTQGRLKKKSSSLVQISW